MTGHEAVNREPVEGRIGQFHRDLLEDLGAVIDIEAGLREVLLQSDHDALVDGLEASVDVEAGLAAVLPEAPQPSMDSEILTSLEPDSLLPSPLLSVSPLLRMELRMDPEFTQALESLESLEEMRQMTFEAYEVAVRLRKALAGGSARRFQRVFHLSLDLTGAIREIEGAVADTSSMIQGAPRHRITEALEETTYLASELARKTDQAGELARSLEAGGTPGRARRIGRAQARQEQSQWAQLLEQVVEDASNLSYRLIDAVGRVMFAVPAYGSAVGRRVQMMVARRIGLPGVPALDAEQLRRFLTDFTTADLRRAALEGVELAGVRWSLYYTLWPAAVDINDLKARSQEDPPGSGIYVIRSGTATVREFAEL